MAGEAGAAAARQNGRAKLAAGGDRRRRRLASSSGRTGRWEPGGSWRRRWRRGRASVVEADFAAHHLAQFGLQLGGRRETFVTVGSDRRGSLLQDRKRGRVAMVRKWYQGWPVRVAARDGSQLRITGAWRLITLITHFTPPFVATWRAVQRGITAEYSVNCSCASPKRSTAASSAESGSAVSETSCKNGNFLNTCACTGVASIQQIHRAWPLTDLSLQVCQYPAKERSEERVKHENNEGTVGWVTVPASSL